MKGQIDITEEMIIDNFAGGGGASTGIELAIGRPVDVAINHDPASIQMHKKNHPYTHHYCEDVWEVDPREVTKGRKVALCWFSPDCKHFSKAKGGKPREKKIRGLAWVAVRWAATVKPRVIILENVEEFKTWGPLNKDGIPDINQKGRTFNSFINALRAQGYEVDWRELKACDYGAPTIRKRFFLIARCDGQPIPWPEPTHGEGKLPYKTAAECVDWSIPTKSIFNRKKPLADNTLARIARGTDKFVIKADKPFLIPVGYGERAGQKPRLHDIENPLSTIVSTVKQALVTPVITSIGHTSTKSRSADVEAPLRTIVSKAEHCIAAPHLIQYHTETAKREHRGQKLTEPIMTIDGSPRYGLAIANLCILRNNMDGKSVKVAEGTDLQHWPKVREMLNKYCGYDLKNDEVLVFEINNALYFIADIGLRMLEPRELYNAQGFPPDYCINFDVDGRRYSKKEQVARCGNSVPPPFAEHLVRANLPEMCGEKYTYMSELQASMAM